jgi:hypothetical protein
MHSNKSIVGVSPRFKNAPSNFLPVVRDGDRAYLPRPSAHDATPSVLPVRGTEAGFYPHALIWRGGGLHVQYFIFNAYTKVDT